MLYLMTHIMHLVTIFLNQGVPDSVRTPVVEAAAGADAGGPGEEEPGCWCCSSFSAYTREDRQMDTQPHAQIRYTCTCVYNYV